MGSFGICLLMILSSAGATPQWIPDPADSKWILLGGETGVLSTHGLEFVPSGEGVLKSASIEQTPCAHSVMTFSNARGQPGYFYLRTEKLEEMSAWLGKGHEPLLTVRYYDEAPGSLCVVYDSADYTCRLNSSTPGMGREAGTIRLAGSKTFKTFEARLPLMRFTRRVNGGDIRVQGKGFALVGAALSRTPKPAEPADGVLQVAENSRVKLEMDRTGLRRLTAKKAGAVYCSASPKHYPLVTLMVKKPGQSPVERIGLREEDFRTFKAESVGPDTVRMRIEWRLANGVEAATEALLLPSGQIEWRLDLDNRSDLEVAEIEFPVLGGFKMGEKPDDYSVFVPTDWGRAVDAAAPAGPFTGMRWMGHWNATGGFYLGIEDPAFPDAAFIRDTDVEQRWNIGIRQWGLVNPGAKWRSAVIRAAVTSADWHEMADLYRAFAAKAMKPCDYPAHVKWLLDAWDTVDANHYPEQGFALLTDGIEKRAPLGIYFFATNRQMIEGPQSYSDVGTPAYPCPAWGSQREFKQQLKAAQARGAMIVPYLNYGNFYRFYQDLIRGRQRVVYYPKSKLPVEYLKYDDEWMKEAVTWSYDGRATGTMAAGSPAWADAVTGACHRYNDWGMDGMYLDQCCLMSPSGRLYPPKHNAYGENLRARTDLLRRIRDEVQRKNPYFTLSGELIIDVMCQALDLPMTSSVFPNLDIYRYCNPTHIMINGGWNGGYQYMGGAEEVRSNWQLGVRFEQMVPRTFPGVAGDKSGRYVGDTSETNVGWDPWDGQVLALRRAVKSILYDADYRDGVGLTVRDASGKELTPERSIPHYGLPPQRGIFGRWFRFAKDGQSGAVINIVNAVSPPEMAEKLTTRKTLTDVMLPLPPRHGAVMNIETTEMGPVLGAVAWTLEGKRFPVNGRQDGNRYTFPVPMSEMSSVVLSCGQLRPVVEWELDNVATPGTRRTLKLKITNANSEPMTGNARLLLPQGWPPIDAVAFGPLKTGETAVIELPVAVPAGVEKRRYDVRCTVQTLQGNFTTYNFMTVNDPVLAELKGAGDRLQLWFRNLTDHVQEVDVKKVALPSPVTTASNTGKLTVAPMNTATVDLTVTGREKLAEIADAEVEVVAAGVRQSLVHAVMPMVPNGNFEADGAGDQKPDWWMVWEQAKPGKRSARVHSQNPDALRLDPDNPHGGKYCLRVEGLAKDRNLLHHRAYPVNGVFAKNTRYRVSVWIRSEAPNGVYLDCFNKRLGEGKTGTDWQRFSAEVQSKADSYARDCCKLVNASAGAAWFDDLVVTDCGPVPDKEPLSLVKNSSAGK